MREVMRDGSSLVARTCLCLIPFGVAVFLFSVFSGCCAVVVFILLLSAVWTAEEEDDDNLLELNVRVANRR